MKQWTSNNTLCCHWCGTPLQSASLVYLNGNLPCCGLCLTKTSDAKAIEEERGKANEIAVGYQLTADDLSKRLHETEEERDALRAELDRKTALYERVTDDFAGEVGSLRAELAAKDAVIKDKEQDYVSLLEHHEAQTKDWESRIAARDRVIKNAAEIARGNNKVISSLTAKLAAAKEQITHLLEDADGLAKLYAEEEELVEAMNDKNREFAELCGSIQYPSLMGGVMWQCPDYAADPRLVLDAINPCDAEDFVNFLLDSCPNIEPENYGPTTIDCCLYLCDLFKDTTGLLRDKAIEWLRRER